MELKDIMVSVFPNVKIKDNPEHLPLLEILEIIRKGPPEIKRKIGAIRKEKDKNKDDCGQGQKEKFLVLLEVFQFSGQLCFKQLCYPPVPAVLPLSQAYSRPGVALYCLICLFICFLALRDYTFVLFMQNLQFAQPEASWKGPAWLPKARSKNFVNQYCPKSFSGGTPGGSPRTFS